MKMIWLYLPVILVAFWILGSIILEFMRKPTPLSVHYDAAIDAAKLLKDWGVWMTTIAVAAIAANGILMGQSGAMRTGGFAAISMFSFCIAVLLDSWLIGCLPAIISGLKEGKDPANDIYELPLYNFLPGRFTRIGFIGNLQQAFFVVAVYALAVSSFLAHEPRQAT